ncbi:UDP-glucose/GDP-mannose dehydrogenase family protein [Telmatospirillum sp. J64-1]|uniref:UDP-glucose dehydrogenase family protein n=1 Tax=Telmatospirillum sp. J64-1 TaxID=2502183 RepID=UPI00115D12D7|nr:UDP-glucose/GDP-mannose dehydrogenase family protein [Telmatospirillum sp. J64-1]
MKVAIIGTGYVGLVTGACLTARGHDVICVDVDEQRVSALNRAETPIHEPGLPRLIEQGVASGQLAATTDLAAAVRRSDLSLICVGTPSSGGHIDLSLVQTAARQIGEALRGHDKWHVVTVKSTVVPGTTGGLVRQTLEQASGKTAGRDFGLAMNPEFLSQGSAVRDFMEPDRVVVGALDERSGAMVAEIYESFDCPVLRTGLTNAEMVKYAANSFQATLISFANQIAAICERLPEADESVVMSGVHLDRLLTLAAPDGSPITAGAARFLKAGIGFGGSCFPKDLVALRHFGRTIGAPTTMLDAVIDTNRNRIGQVCALLEQDLDGLAGRKIAVLGLTFKPDTDDLRESRGLALITRLAEAGAEIRAHDPLPAARRAAADKLDGQAVICDSLPDTLAGMDAAVIATAWPDYRDCDWQALSLSMRRPIVLDGRGLLAGQRLPGGMRYRRIGVGPETALRPAAE